MYIKSPQFMPAGKVVVEIESAVSHIQQEQMVLIKGKHNKRIGLGSHDKNKSTQGRYEDR
jgi:hypothetical protein